MLTHIYIYVYICHHISLNELKSKFYFSISFVSMSLQWSHNGRDSVSNHQPHDCLLNRLFRRRSKKTSKPRVTGLCAGNSPVTGGQLRGKCFHLMTSSCCYCPQGMDTWSRFPLSAKISGVLIHKLGWVGLWGFLWWAPSVKRKDHHGVSSGWSSVWHRSNTGLSSTQYEQIPIILGVWPFWLTPFVYRSITFWRAHS